MYRSVSVSVSVNVDRDNVADDVELKAAVCDLVSICLEDDEGFGRTEKVRIKVEQRKAHEDGACADCLDHCDRCVVQEIISHDGSRNADHGADGDEEG